MLIYRVLGMKCWLEKTVFGFSRWEYDIEPVKSSASFKIINTLDPKFYLSTSQLEELVHMFFRCPIRTCFKCYSYIADISFFIGFLNLR